MKVLVYEQRKCKDLTLVSLALITGISKSTLNRIEDEITSPTLIQLEAIAMALECRITDLFMSKYK